MHFEDFHIQLGIDRDRYSAKVAKSPAGEGTSWFEAPFRIGEIQPLLDDLQRCSWHARLQGSPAAVASPDKNQARLIAQRLGGELFEALFQGEVRSLFDASLDKVRASGRGLRLRLQLDVRRGELARLQELPWELLYLPDRSEFIGLSLQVSIVRHLEVPRGVETLPLPSPLRILAVAANPSALPQLDLTREIEHLQGAWRSHTEVEVVLLEAARLEALHDALASGPFHVLHFMGHGTLDERTQEGALIFERSGGEPQPVGGRDLSHLLQGFRGLRLAVLNACVTARAPSGSELDPFAGVATALVQGGLPAVIAMQLPLSDDAAVAFSRSLYQRLAAGDPIETALAHGRKAIHASDPRSMEWGTPVLFLRSAGDRLFEPRPRARTGSVETGVRTTLLERIESYWIEGVLEKSLHGQAMLELGLQTEPHDVAHPWEMVLEIREREGCRLPQGTRISQVFEKAGRSLLILGDPGSGKTTILLDLARVASGRARKDAGQPLPIVFNLSTWSDSRPPLRDWLVGELLSKYQIPKKMGRDLVDRNALLVLLDGLDEVRSEHRLACVEAVHDFLKEHLVPVAVCCRTPDYRAISRRLELQAAVVLQPLTAGQIEEYLEHAGPRLAALREEIHRDEELRKMAHSPLLLNILTLAYQDVAAEGFAAARGDEHQRRHHLFETYIQRMLERRNRSGRYQPEHLRKWLQWLAERMVESNQTIFLVEEMQPAWLKSGRWLYSLLVSVATLPLLIWWLPAVPDDVWDSTAKCYVLFLTGIVPISRAGARIRMRLSFNWSPHRGMRFLLVGVFAIVTMALSYAVSEDLVATTLIVSTGWGMLGSIIGSVAESKFGLPESLKRFTVYGFLYGLSLSLCIALIAVVVHLIYLPECHAQLISRIGSSSLKAICAAGPLFFMFGISGISTGPRKTNLKASKTACDTLLLGVLVVLASIYLFWISGPIWSDARNPTRSEGLAQLGLFTFFATCAALPHAYPCIQHYCLRFMLALQRRFPWRIDRFLEAAVDCALLQRVGGGHIFMHRLLLEHLAGPGGGESIESQGESRAPRPFAWLATWKTAPGGRIFPIRECGIVTNICAGIALLAGAFLFLRWLAGLLPMSDDAFALTSCFAFALSAWLLGRGWRFGVLGFVGGAMLGGWAVDPNNLPSSLLKVLIGTPIFLALTFLVLEPRIAKKNFLEYKRFFLGNDPWK